MVRSSSERLLNEVLFSPHTRGWSEDVARLHLVADRSPRTRGDGPSSRKASRFSVMGSPRTRGDGPRADAMRMKNSEVLPAHAGMVRCITLARRPSPSSPRTRGDGPTARAGALHPGVRSPRTRGDGPFPSDRYCNVLPVLPAHAGMVRSRSGFPRPSSRRSPRTRGDGPYGDTTDAQAQISSPRTRGDGPNRSASQRPAPNRSPRTRGDGPGRPTRRAHPSTSSPRTRGDGPTGHTLAPLPTPFSPHTRGWSGV